MKRCLLLLALPLAACGGPDRETFALEANEACRQRAAGQEELAGLPQDELLPAQAQLYEQGLERLRALEPPDELRGQFADWVRAEAELAAAWNRYAASPGAAGRERVLAKFEDASALAGDLGLGDCDS